jgi:hypothetical protein
MLPCSTGLLLPQPLVNEDLIMIPTVAFHGFIVASHSSATVQL